MAHFSLDANQIRRKRRQSASIFLHKSCSRTLIVLRYKRTFIPLRFYFMQVIFLTNKTNRKNKNGAKEVELKSHNMILRINITVTLSRRNSRLFFNIFVTKTNTIRNTKKKRRKLKLNDVAYLTMLI